MERTVLVTGGAGYIGSHVALALLDAGYGIVVLDNLSTGDERLIPKGVPFIHSDVASSARVQKALVDHKIDAVIHLAGSLIVPESVQNPLFYYRNNTIASHALIEACVKQGVRQFVFSSSAAVYGEPERLPLNEESPVRPLNPYGASKLMTEWILRDVANAHEFCYVSLRYFNVAGADPAGRSGQVSKTSTHLIKVAVETALGQRPSISIFGIDYPTPDGTCIRDFIHVSDLARVHVAAIDYLAGGGKSGAFNCGIGRGYSVREVLKTVEDVVGHPFPVLTAPRRAGDPSAMVCDASKITRCIGWQPRHTELRSIIESTVAWEIRYRRSATGL